MKLNTILKAFAIFTIGIFIAVCNVQARDWPLAEQDSLALVAFYHATDGDNWISNQGDFSTDILKDDIDEYYASNPNAPKGKWLNGPVKNWFGVMLQKQAFGTEGDSVYRVVRLWPVVGRRENGQNNLNGYVPRELGFLTALKWFRLNGNDGLTWTELPDEVYHPTIERFDVEKCELGGVVSDAFRSCTNINYINLRYNKFDYMPTLDFIDPEIWMANNASIIWVYSTRLSFAILEPTIDYFYTLSPTPKRIKIEARDMNNVGAAREIIVTKGEKATLVSDQAGLQGTVTWYKKGFNTYITGNEFKISSVSDTDTGEYKALIANDYVKEYDQNTNYGNVFTKPIYVRYAPVQPVANNFISAYSGNEITVTCSKPMQLPANNSYADFEVNVGENSYAITGIQLSGRNSERLVLTINKTLPANSEVLISYNGSQIKCTNGGLLKTFENKPVENRARTAPTLVSAITRKDGMGIILEFDKYIDSETFADADFTLPVNPSVAVSGITLLEGEIDAHISKKVQLTLSEMLDAGVTIKINYNKGALTGLYSGAVQSFSNFDVTNIVENKRTDVTLTFFDGSGKFNNIFIKGNISVDAIKMYDNATNGDSVANDSLFTTVIPLVNGSYNWQVVNRTLNINYDTLSVTDTLTGITTITLVPDSLLSDTTLNTGVLSFDVTDSGVSGKTSTGIKNNHIVITLNMQPFVNEYPAEKLAPYIMGINNDWVTGLPLTQQNGDSTLFSITLKGYSTNETINYNFRNGSIWENTIVSTRTYIVKEGENKLNLKFGDIYTGFQSQKHNAVNKNILIYPNPSTTHFNISKPENVEEVSVFGLNGKLLKQWHGPFGGYNVHDLPNGTYMVVVQYTNRDRVTQKINISH